MFSTLKYAPKYAKYGQVGRPWKDLAKCSSDALVFGEYDPPVKSYDQISFLVWSHHWNYYVKHRMPDGWPRQVYGSINLKTMCLLYIWIRTTQHWSKKISKLKKVFWAIDTPLGNVCLISGWEKGQDRKIWCQRNRRWGKGDLIDSIEGT